MSAKMFYKAAQEGDRYAVKLHGEWVITHTVTQSGTSEDAAKAYKADLAATVKDGWAYTPADTVKAKLDAPKPKRQKSKKDKG